MNEELVVPVDDSSLALILEALNTSYDLDEDRNPVLVGGAFTLTQLLDFWSGYSAALKEGTEPPVILSLPDVIRALIEEIQRLRSTDVP